MSSNGTFLVRGTVCEITNYPLYYSILVVPFMNVNNDPYYIPVRVYKNNPNITKEEYNWIKQIEPYMSIDVEVKRENQLYMHMTINKLIRLWSVSARSYIPVQYCPTHDSFYLLLDSKSPIQCCTESHEPIVSYTPIMAREKYLENRKE